MVAGSKSERNKQAAMAILVFSLGMVFAILLMTSQHLNSSSQLASSTPTLQGAFAQQPKTTNLQFNYAPGNICSKIQTTNSLVRNTAASVAKNSSGRWNIDQLVDMYVWMKANVAYVNDPEGKDYYAYASETLEVGAGDCDDQAILATSMIESIGGTSKILVGYSCGHAVSSVYVGNSTEHYESIVKSIKNRYSEKYNTKISGDFNKYVDEDGGIWLVIDTTGGLYPGDILPECKENEFDIRC